MDNFSESDSDGQQEPARKRCKRGKRKTEEYKQSKIKKAKLQGLEHVNHKGMLVPKKTIQPLCRCKAKCYSLFSEHEQTQILEKINSFETKTLQDLYLQGLIERQPIRRRRPRTEAGTVRIGMFKYHVLINGSVGQCVCQKTFLAIHCVSKKRVRRLQDLLVKGQTPEEHRGKARRPNFEISAEDISKIDEHIRSYATKITHYTSKPKKYLDARLNVKMMHDMFIIKYPNSKVKYEYFLKYYHENFDYHFGRPQVDTCVTCEELNLKIQSQILNETAKRVPTAELGVHKMRAKKFYKKMQEVKDMCQNNVKIQALAFDFMQNLPLPVMPVQDVFYLRQLWVFVFGIHNIGDNETTIYFYKEGDARKGSNDVCSMLLKYIKETIPQETEELHLFCDSCTCQNRNHTMVRMLISLTAARFKKIYQYYPERGHSFLPCDRDFALIKRKVKVADRIYTMDEYCAMILSARKVPFNVKRLLPSDVLELKNWWAQYYKKTCVPLEKLRPGQKRSPGDSFSVTGTKMFIYEASKPGIVTTYQRIDGLIRNSYKLLKGHEVPRLPVQYAYTNQVPINEKKIADLKKLMDYIPDEHKEFYNVILNWKTSANDDDDDFDDEVRGEH